MGPGRHTAVPHRSYLFALNRRLSLLHKDGLQMGVQALRIVFVLQNNVVSVALVFTRKSDNARLARKNGASRCGRNIYAAVEGFASRNRAYARSERRRNNSLCQRRGHARIGKEKTLSGI